MLLLLLWLWQSCLLGTQLPPSAPSHLLFWNTLFFSIPLWVQFQLRIQSHCILTIYSCIYLVETVMADCKWNVLFQKEQWATNLILKFPPLPHGELRTKLAILTKLPIFVLCCRAECRVRQPGKTFHPWWWLCNKDWPKKIKNKSKIVCNRCSKRVFVFC